MSEIYQCPSCGVVQDSKEHDDCEKGNQGDLPVIRLVKDDPKPEKKGKK